MTITANNDVRASRLLGANPAARMRTRLVGREREFVELHAQWRRAKAGEFRTVLLVGEAGVGKTRLTQELQRRYHDDAITLTARAHPLGDTTSFGLWAEALEHYLRDLPPGTVSELGGGFLEDLAGLIRSAAAAHGGAPHREAPRSRLLEGIARLLGALGRQSPVIIVLDDMHLADASSWDCLHYLAHDLADARILVVLAARPAELTEQVGASSLLAGLEQEEVLHRLAIAPLDPGGLRELASEVLDQTPPESLVSWLGDRCRGNPLFALGLLRALVEEAVDLSAPTLRALPERLVEHVVCRTGRLSGAQRSLLELLVVVGRPIELRRLVRLSQQSLESLAADLDVLVRSGLAAEAEEHHSVFYDIGHPLIQEAIYQRIGAAQRRVLHRQVARSLVAEGDQGEAARHFARSSFAGDAEAVDALRSAMEQCEQRGAYREALTILQTLVELLPRGDVRWLAIVDAMSMRAEWVVDHRADVHAVLGIDALRAIDVLLADSPDPARRAIVKFRLMNFLAWGTGRLDEAERAGREAEALFMQARDVSGVLLASNELAWIRALQGDLDAQARHGLLVLEHAEAAGDHYATTQALALLGINAFWRGAVDDSEDYFRRSERIAREIECHYRCNMALAGRALCLALDGRSGESLPLLDDAKVLPGWQEGVVLEWETMVHWLAGDYRKALDAASESVAWNPAGTSKRRAIGIAVAVLAADEVGDVVEARRYLARAERAFEDRAFVFYDSYVDWAAAVLAWRNGDCSTALSRLRSATERILDVGADGMAVFPLLDLAELGVAAGDPDAARDAAERLGEIATRLNRPFHQGLAALARAWAALGTGDTRTAVSDAEEATKLLASLDSRGLYGRALGVLGRALIVEDRPRAGLMLKEAAACFEACGAGRRREESLKLLATLGRSARRTATSLRSSVLTPRERETARLAAEGWSARDIAAELGIGERTVESYLAGAYAKLGVSSKVELARRAASLSL